MACKAAVLAGKGAKKIKKVMEMLPKLSLDEKKEVAQAVTANPYREAYDVLACLVREDDKEMKILALKGFAANKDPRALVHLNWLREKGFADDADIKAAIKEAMDACRETHKEM